MSEQSPVDAKALSLKKLQERVFKLLDYWVLFLYVTLVSIGALLADYAIVAVTERVFASDIAKYPIVSQAFDWFKIGSAFLVFIVASFHAAFSAWSQIKFEMETAKEQEEGEH